MVCQSALLLIPD